VNLERRILPGLYLMSDIYYGLGNS
jgi:hypothetical protein